LSAIQGNADIALGNIVGSNIFNILGIMGVTALVRPVIVQRSNVLYDVPFAVLSSIAITATVLLPDSCGKRELGRGEGILMLCFFAIFICYTLSIASSMKVAQEQKSSKSVALWKSVLGVVVGLALLFLGGNWLVDGASGIASAMGISESIIALTIVSIGTSAPEFAASVMAAKKGDTAMALGNVVGSVVFNVFYVLGTAAAIQPLSAKGITTIDIIILLVSSILLWIFCAFGKKNYTLTRSEGFVFILLMIAYYVYLIINESTL
ncbi:MAG: sodium:calcium antiporter, partial [Prevotella sp.]|nr:sodium:calcium antiporter [Prevotella sp.]